MKAKFVVTAILLAALAYFSVNGDISHFISDVIYDNEAHRVPCKDLPDSAAVKQVAANFADELNQVENIAPGYVHYDINAGICDGSKADITFYYGSHEQRLAIKALVGESFHGVPYNLVNR